MKTLILLSLICISTVFFSCEKCVTCKQISASNDSLSINYPEVCGSDNNIIDYQDRLEKNKPPQNKLECTEKVTHIWD